MNLGGDQFSYGSNDTGGMYSSSYGGGGGGGEYVPRGSDV